MRQRLTPAWQRAFRSCQEHPVRSEEAATAARHNGLSQIQHHHRLHCVRSQWGWSHRGAERGMSRRAAPPAPGYPHFPPKGWQGEEKSLPGKIDCLREFARVQWHCSSHHWVPRSALRGQGLAYSPLTVGEHAAQGGSLSFGVPLCLDGAGAMPSLQKLIHNGAGLGCPLQMPKKGREDGRRDVVRVVPWLLALPRDALGGRVRLKGFSGGCSWL